MQLVQKQRNSPRTSSVATAGAINPITRKRYLDDQYAKRTIRHNNSVIRAFYEFWIEELHEGPLVNPIPRDRGRGGNRPNAHHNPLEPFRAEGKLRYNPKLPKQRPREMPDECWKDVFSKLTSNRHRASPVG
ncbi:hypothetical protein [Amycolatopsis sp. NPDC049868]|uniref:hypothetical protein n=1 Tax=Amycolatopsis sp. NPDC049868 TaxID=3363934 RepID=UPI00378CA6B9